MSQQFKLALVITLVLLTFAGQTGLAMAKLTCLCFNKTTWAWQWEAGECPFDTLDLDSKTCAAEKSCCSSAETCSSESEGCTDECLTVDMTWFNADLEASFNPVMQESNSASLDLNTETFPAYFLSSVYSYAGQFSLPPPKDVSHQLTKQNLQSKFCIWLC